MTKSVDITGVLAIGINSQYVRLCAHICAIIRTYWELMVFKKTSFKAGF